MLILKPGPAFEGSFTGKLQISSMSPLLKNLLSFPLPQPRPWSLTQAEELSQFLSL